MDRNRILEELAAPEGLPWRAILSCLNDPDRSRTVFISLLKRSANGRPMSETEAAALYFGVHILGAIGDSRSLAPLLNFLSTDSSKVDAILGDAVGDTLSRVLMALDAGNPGILAISENPGIDWLIREACLRAWTYSVLTGTVPREEAARYLGEFPNTAALDPESFLWSAWLIAIADLGLEELRPLAEDAFAAGRLRADEFGSYPADFKVFEDDLAEAVQPHDLAEWMQRKRYRPFSGNREDFQTACIHRDTLPRFVEARSASDPLVLQAAEHGEPFNRSPT